jgi:hypothetical protein
MLTAVTVALVCERPAGALHSWGRVFSLATMYLVVAGTVHALAVWGVCRVREESEQAGWPLIWQVIWVGWIAIVWLPLISLLTSERSVWVAAVLPVTAIFARVLLKDRARVAEGGVQSEVGDRAAHGLLWMEEATPIWRVLLPAILTAAAAQMGIAMLVGRRDWIAGCLLGVAAIYPVKRWLDSSAGGELDARSRYGRRLCAAAVVASGGSGAKRRFPSGMTKEEARAKRRFPSGMTKEEARAKRRFPSGMTKERGKGETQIPSGMTEGDGCG